MSETETASVRRCGVCKEIQHRMSTFVSPSDEFDFDAVCEGCVSHYLKTGEWGGKRKAAGPIATIEFEESAVKDYLDQCIRFWRAVEGPHADYYVDAYQSVRISLFDEELP